MPKKSTTTPGIFSPRSISFLKELKTHNNRDWFAENKPRYEQDVLEPALEFVRQMQPRLAKHSRYLTAEAKRMGGAIMRIYRDTRFSNDKTPYKTNVGIHFRHSVGGDVHAPGLYVHLEPNACFLAAGIWMPSAEPLSMIRNAIVEESSEWLKVKKNKKFAARFLLEGDSLKKAPRGFDINHPCIDDLRRKSFAGIAKVDDKEFYRPDFPEFAMSVFDVAKPLMKFLCDALGQPY
jgi:uncharacterized protein (TIGR02453 family)